MEHVDADVRRDLHASAFESLVEHLRVNTGVQNIDMMTVSGFCRNCLSKWIFRGAKEHGLDLTYEQALEEVYGMSYADWKANFQTKASPEKLAALEASKDIHAQHPGLDFKKSSAAQEGAAPPRRASGPIMSDVCCQDPDTPAESKTAEAMVKSLQCWAPPSGKQKSQALRLGILTISDRASQGVYEDESGPEIEKCVKLFSDELKVVALEAEPTRDLVPDEAPKIAEALKKMAETCNLVLTTGGTGLSPRDVTPEATLQVVQREVRGIPESIRRETAKVEPLAMLSRAVAGVRNDATLIVNLPGRPKAVREALAVLLPALPHILAQLEPHAAQAGQASS